MDESTLKKAMRLMGARGGFAAAKNMTPAERKARAKKASLAAAEAKAQAKVRAKRNEGK